MKTVCLGECVTKVATWNPARTGEVAKFSYIDIGAVNQQSKQIEYAELVTCAEAPSRARQLVEVDDVLVSTVRPNLNAVAKVLDDSNKATASTGFCVLRANKKIIDPNYLFNWVKTDLFVNDMVKKATGASYPAVSDKIIFNSSISLPSLEEQKRIAAILDNAAEIKAKREQTIAKLDALLDSTFTELFLKDGKWPTSKLTEVCKTTSGGTPKRDVANYYGGDIFWVKSGELDVDLVLKTEETLTLDGVKNSSAKVMPPKTVLLAMYGATIGAVSMLGVSAATNQAICCITTGEKLLPEFLMYYLKSIKKDLIKLAVGGAQPNINQEIVRNLSVPIPPAGLQKMFLERAEAIRQQIIKYETSLAQINTTITSLQHQAFTTGFAA